MSGLSEQAGLALLGYWEDRKSGALWGLIYSLFALLFLGGLVFAMLQYLRRRLTRPMKRVTDALDRLAAGDLSIDIGHDRGDLEDVARLGHALEIFREKMRTFEEESKERLDSVLSNAPRRCPSRYPYLR